VRRVEDEARRLGSSPSGLLAEIVEGWARQVRAQSEENGLQDEERPPRSAAAWASADHPASGER